MGDPVKAAKVIADVAEAAEQPMRLQIGADCVARVEEQLSHIRARRLAHRRGLHCLRRGTCLTGAVYVARRRPQ
ncbi:hypothetical protein [Pseudonocardia alaniniphila]|uniref:Uncharacterized protein n=1 Tax=Pseudonocardia alaniniphila TaxID=75291 RepID=A0ABS9T769_9PSEU|nr:hypothetical protein [Pseudonocardia alaniniphila]MCH6164373.1 hypothetical protein [Pseudonocardia alaniniphila]